MEAPFAIYGVLDCVVGYMGGDSPNPTYADVCTGRSGHVEVVHIQYDATQIPYTVLVDIFLKHHDPSDAGGQFADRGPQYASTVFYYDAHQRACAESAIAQYAQSMQQPCATHIRPAMPVTVAEAQHQGYAASQPVAYAQYYHGSGRATAIQEQQMRGLTDHQRHVIHGGTEPPFDNAYWDHKAPGVYVDCVSGEPLFRSQDKYDSGTGWPSFTAPLVPLMEVEDYALGYCRTEVRAPKSSIHLGHVFPDGPQGGRRFCINSAALVFHAI
jgi:peptide methionine sulfoxide reductase msrA/msrB